MHYFLVNHNKKPLKIVKSILFDILDNYLVDQNLNIFISSLELNAIQRIISKNKATDII